MTADGTVVIVTASSYGPSPETLSAINYLVHQCNMRTSYAKGLAQSIFHKYPVANCYANRSARASLGQIQIDKVSEETHIVHLFGQDFPGGPRSPETARLRLKWFESGLGELLEVLKSVKKEKVIVAFPKGIGCGLAPL